MKPTIAHYLDKDFRIHHDFIYNQIVKPSGFRSIVIGPFSRNKNTHYPLKEFYNLKRIKKFGSFCKKKNIIAVHAHHGGEALNALPFVKKHKVPLIVHFRGRDASAAKGAYHRNARRYKELRKKGAMFITVCHTFRNHLKKLGFPKKKIRVLYGGIDLKKFSYKERTLPPKGEIRILSVGRLVPKKGHATLIHAFKKVHRKHPRARLHIIGFGRGRKHLTRIINKNGLQGLVKLRGKMAPGQITRELHKSHIFCLCSQTASDGDIEGIPNAIKEAMATGLVVVATNNGGIPEIVKHKQTGYLVPEKNNNKLSKGLLYLIEHPHLWKSYSRNGRKWVEQHFNLKKQLKAQEKLYSEILNR